MFFGGPIVGMSSLLPRLSQSVCAQIDISALEKETDPLFRQFFTYADDVMYHVPNKQTLDKFSRDTHAARKAALITYAHRLPLHIC